jgi:hypothetical protein
MYSDVKTLWVEPRTGIIIKGAEDVTQILQTDAGVPVLTAFKGSLSYDQNTIGGNVDDAKTAIGQLRLIQWTLPIGGLVLGVLLIVGGTLLLGRHSRGGRHAAGQTEEMEPQPQADAP